jgi:hypothetical protein
VLHLTQVSVIASPLARDEHVGGVMKVVAPHRVETQATALARAHDARVIQITLPDQIEVPPELLCASMDDLRKLLEERLGGAIDDRVHGVQAQRIDVEVFQPH